TCPFGSNVAVYELLSGVMRSPVSIHTPVAGSYSSALVNPGEEIPPPATSTCPSCSNVAVCAERSNVMLPVFVHTLLPGSYSSALAKFTSVKPPATSTCLFGSNVAVAKERVVDILPVTVHCPVAGLYSSVLVPLMASPPATSTCPVVNNVAVCVLRPTCML